MKVNYQNAKIYKIIDNVTNAIYVGSTCKTLEHRLRAHEYNFKAFKANKQNFITSFKILQNADYKIELIKLYPCTTKQELELEEGKMIKQFRNEKLNIVNKFVAGQTRAQYYQKNKIAINEQRNQKHNCSCGGKFSQCNKLHHEKTKKHQAYINNSKTIINNGTLNITINLNNPEDLAKLDFLKTVNK